MNKENKDKKKILIYDTTLRDGAQMRGISFSLEDKLKIACLLDKSNFHYIEGGWPGSNPKDCEFFDRVKDMEFKNAKIVAFGSTRRHDTLVEDDLNIKTLLEAKTPVVTLVGKSSSYQVKEVLCTTLEENLNMISDSIRFLKEQGREVIYDAEHFFDGYKLDSGYSIETLKAAINAGVDGITLCDTNGGCLTWEIQDIVSKVSKLLKQESLKSQNIKLGIHVHNDMGLAVINSMVAACEGCTLIQGTVNGYGERCGNANLITIIPNLQIKMGYDCVPDLTHLTELSHKVSGIANFNPDEHAPYVGLEAFAHKGGIHVSAVERDPQSYEHITPETVGNKRKFVISELAGRSNVRVRATELGLKLSGNEKAVLNKVKELEHQGFQFENAEGTFELLLRKDSAGYKPPFEKVDMMVVSENRKPSVKTVEAVVKLKVGNTITHTVADGLGPVHALDLAIRKSLLPYFPELAKVNLSDYKVRILDPDKTTGATTRVTIDATYEGERWSTVGVSYNIIEASYAALIDSYELFLLRQQTALNDKKASLNEKQVANS